jgi:hypothetical protein
MRFGGDSTMRGILLAAAILCSVVVADEYFNSGHFTDGALSMLQHIKWSFGF